MQILWFARDFCKKIEKKHGDGIPVGERERKKREVLQR